MGSDTYKVCKKQIPFPVSAFLNIRINCAHTIIYCIVSSHTNDLSVYFLINRDFPVISAGFSIPISSIRVGTISARHPPSLKV